MCERLPQYVLPGPSSALSPGQHGRDPVQNRPALVLSSPSLFLSGPHLVEGAPKRSDLLPNTILVALAPTTGVAEAPKLCVRGDEPKIHRPS